MQPYMNKRNFEHYGEGGYQMYRIPGIVVTRKGTVLAYYEARMGPGDWTKQDVILRRSEDRGETWSDRIMLVEGSKEETFHNCIMICGTADDTIHLLWHQDYAKCMYRRSMDEGLTWSEPTDISEVFERFREEYDWNVIANGTGHGLQLCSGRMVIPVWLSNGGEMHRPSVLSSIYSDDGGTTWERGSIIWDRDGWNNPSEATVVELSDGRVLMNFRHESDKRCRGVVVSEDGGMTWGQPLYDEQLPDPICEGALERLAFPETDGYSGILFSNCAFDGEGQIRDVAWYDSDQTFKWGSGVRRNLTVRLSLDEGKTWAYSKMLEEYSGYSDLAVSADGRKLFCLYERDWVDGENALTKHMALATFNLAWLTDGKFTGKDGPKQS